MIRWRYGRAERRHPSAEACTGTRISRAFAFQLSVTEAGASRPFTRLRAAATTVTAATSAATSSSVASPWTIRRIGPSATRLAHSDPELPVYPRPERVPQPFTGLLVGAQRLAEFLLRLDEQLLVDDGRQDRAGQQVPDVVRTPGENPLVRDVLAGLLDVPPVRAEARQRAGL